MADEKCGCGQEQEATCAECRREETFSYWCSSCDRAVPDKRCPYCGLKSKKRK